MFLTSFCVAYVGILPNFILFLFKPLVISSQLVEEFHNKVECWQKVVVHLVERLAQPLLMAPQPSFLVPFIKLPLGVVIIVLKVMALLGTIVSYNGNYLIGSLI
jgi:hypothetical protein